MSSQVLPVLNKSLTW